MKSSPTDATKEQSLQPEDAPEESQLRGAIAHEAARFVLVFVKSLKSKGPLSLDSKVNSFLSCVIKLVI